MEGSEPLGTSAQRAAADRAGPVPSRPGRPVLLFLGVTLAEYWLAPLFVGLTNFAGLWSVIGNLLFAALVTVLIAFVLRPLLPHLREAFAVRFHRAAFVGLVSAGLLVGLFGTNTLSLGAGPLASENATWVPVYTPFGSFPSLLLAGPLEGVVNLEGVTTVLLLAILGAALLVVRRTVATRACPVPDRTNRTGWTARLAWAAIWSPFGLVSSCSVCTPAYLALLGVFAPATAATAYSGLPLAPWIGFAGLLYLVSLGLVLLLLARATEPIASRPREGSS